MTYKEIIVDLLYITKYQTGRTHDDFCAYWANLVLQDGFTNQGDYFLEDIERHTGLMAKFEFYHTTLGPYHPWT